MILSLYHIGPIRRYRVAYGLACGDPHSPLPFNCLDLDVQNEPPTFLSHYMLNCSIYLYASWMHFFGDFQDQILYDTSTLHIKWLVSQKRVPSVSP